MYESINIGTSYNYKPNLSIALSAGSQFGIVKSTQYYVFSIEHDITIRKNKNELSNWTIDQRFFFWYLEDKYYKFRVLSMEPAFGRIFKLNSKLNLKIDIGPVFMFVLYSKRKTFEEVGWPRYFNCNVNARFSYKL